MCDADRASTSPPREYAAQPPVREVPRRATQKLLLLPLPLRLPRARGKTGGDLLLLRPPPLQRVGVGGGGRLRFTQKLACQSHGPPEEERLRHGR